jgi:hypothetical protein
MAKIISACGILCSGCAAFGGEFKGLEYQKRTVTAWRRIYGMRELPERIACAGCLGPDEKAFHTSLRCKARNCCRAKGFTSCAACVEAGSCALLEKAQSVWDVVPMIAEKLSPADLKAYAKPYLGHRYRLAAAHAARSSAKRPGRT